MDTVGKQAAFIPRSRNEEINEGRQWNHYWSNKARVCVREMEPGGTRWHQFIPSEIGLKGCELKGKKLKRTN